MIIHVRLLGGLGGPGSADEQRPLDLPIASTVADLRVYLKIPARDAHIIVLNGLHAENSEILKEGDTVSIFPPVAGG